VGALRGDVTLDAAPDALALRRAVLREVVGALADLARAAVDVDALAVLRAISDEVSGLAADEAFGEFVVGPRLLAVARGVLLASAVVADLIAPRAALRAAFFAASSASLLALARGVVGGQSMSMKTSFLTICLSSSSGWSMVTSLP